MRKKPGQKAKKPNKPQLLLTPRMASKTGKKATDIFSVPSPKNEVNLLEMEEKEPDEPKTVEVLEVKETSSTEKNPRGRPQEHTEARTKVTVILFDRQISWLDQLALNIRNKTKAAISRAEILRAMVDAIGESELDLSSIKSESEIKQMILNRVKR